MRIAMTGATGFVGRALVPRLLHAGHTLTAITRATSRTDSLREAGVACVVGDLVDPQSMAAAIEGHELLLHLAGGSHTVGTQHIERDNLRTTAGVCEGARRAGAGRVVFVSSMAAGGPRDEIGAPSPERPLSRYGRAKAAAEALLREQHEVHVTILRPPALYGPGDDRLLPLFSAARRGVVTLPSAVRTGAFLHVDDCASAIHAAVDHAPPHGTTWGLDDGGPHRWEDVVAWVGHAVGRSPRTLRVPMPVLAAAGALGEAWSVLTRTPSIVHRDKVADMHGAHWVSDPTALRQATGWSARVPLPEGLAATADDYRARGLLGPRRAGRAG